MNIMHAKLPFAPQDWSVLRSGKYLAKLALFIIVPGLHQIACKRWVLGGLVFAIYVVSMFAISNTPFEFGVMRPSTLWARYTSSISLVLSWALLALDFRHLKIRSLKFGYAAPLAIVILLQFLPLHHRSILFIHVVKNNSICEKFCENDVVTYNLHDGDNEKISIGQFILVPSHTKSRYLAKVVMNRTAERCSSHFPLNDTIGIDAYRCIDGIKRYEYDFLVLGGPEPGYTTSEGVKLTPISNVGLIGINLKKIGNTRAYSVASENVSDLIGNALLTVFKWTGLNLFDLPVGDWNNHPEKAT
jgi:hypothetical protein